MQLFTLGINHQTAPLAFRERVVFHAEQLSDALKQLVKRQLAREAAILSTCNRTELYCTTDQPQTAATWMAEFHSLNPEELHSYLYTLPQEQAVRHAFRVASGLDSMVLGEPQILGQMKQAFEAAKEAGSLGVSLYRLFERSFAVAKEIRTTTAIGTQSVSMAAAAVKLAERIFPEIQEQNVLLIGAGEMVELCATHFAAKAPRRITVANRTLDRATHLADRFNGRAIRLADLAEQLPENDIVISCTASSLPLIGLGMVERAIRTRRHRPIFMLDLAVPRDIEPEVKELDDIFLYTLDDLAELVQIGTDTRKSAVTQAEAIIETNVGGFLRWLETRELVPVIRQLCEQTEKVRQNELQQALKMLARGEDPKQVLEIFSQTMSNKFLHGPLHALNHADPLERETLLTLLDQLYHFNDKK